MELHARYCLTYSQQLENYLFANQITYRRTDEKSGMILQRSFWSNANTLAIYRIMLSARIMFTFFLETLAYLNYIPLMANM